MKLRSTFFTEKNIEKIRVNSEGTDARNYILDEVIKWDAMSMDELWDLMFCNELVRAQEVIKSSWCPACREVAGWAYDPFKKPWKVWCTHCKEEFPKNDFKKYYMSGLNNHNEFKYVLADKSILYNEEAPDPNDPIRMFGVDDGNGFFEGETSWFFIAYYIQAGIWAEQMVVGIKTLARAYLLTGEKRYARKCGIMIDRIADLFPEFDFYEQGKISEERYASRGYVSYWCESVRQIQYILLAYDAIFEFIKDDKEFISFVVEKSEKYKTPCRKETFKDIQISIETRIFKEAAAEKWKIAANFPFANNYIILSKMVLSRWPEKPSDMKWVVYCTLWWTVEEEIKYVIEKATLANGMSGEKGYISYSTLAMNELARMLTFVGLYDESFFENIVRQYPKILEGIQLYMNGWMIGSYYPGCGDSGGGGTGTNRGIPIGPGYSSFTTSTLDSTILYSFDSFLWRLYKASGNINILRYMYNSDNFETEKLFTTDFTLNSKETQKEYLELIKKHGSEIEQHSMNAYDWKLMLLHSGKGKNKRSAFLDCDSGGVHGHNDGMSIALYAKGMNFMPDLGVPPGHRGGNWYSRFYYWNRSAASHNTVIVDRKEHRDFCYAQRDINRGQGMICESGKTTLWGVGSWVKAGGANDPMVIGEKAKRFERTLALVDVTEEDCYFFDIFRVKGGKEHIKLTCSYICDLETNASDFKPYIPYCDPYGMCFINDKNPDENFDYTIDDSFKLIRDTMIAGKVPESFCADYRYTGKYNKYLGWPEDKNHSLRYYDLTKDFDIITYTSFSDSYGLALAANKDLKLEHGQYPEEMLPGVAVMRRSSGQEELESVFIGIYEPCDSGKYLIKEAKRLKTEGETDLNKGAVAFTVETKYGTDLILAADVQNKDIIFQKDWGVKTDASMCILRRSAKAGYKLIMLKGSFFEMSSNAVRLDSITDIFEAIL